MPRPIPIGLTDGRKVRLSQERRSTHLHIMGASGQGKSKFMEHCIREDIMAGHGVCLVDPEGVLYEKIVNWCAKHKANRFARIHLFDPTEPDWRFRFNPLFVHEGEKPRHRVDNVIDALAQVWGGEDSRSKPAIRTTLRAIFTVLIAHGYSLAEAFYLTSTRDPYSIVDQLTGNITNPIIAEMWDGYKQAAEKSPREHQIEFSGARRRFGELLDDEEIRQIFASYENPIDFKQCMDDGDIVLINLAPEAMGEDPARAFGALLVREMFYAASRRDESSAREKPFYAYIDECAEYLTNDIPKILARSRKRGLHLILAHQWLEQLRERGDGIYHGVMGIQNKVIFGGISDEDAIILADQLFRTEYDLEQPVKTLIKPTVVDYQRTWLHNWSEAASDSDALTEAESATEHYGSAESTSETTMVSFDQFGFPVPIASAINSGRSSATSQSASSSSNSSRSSSRTSANAEGASETLEPILEERATAVHGLENIRHMAVTRLRSIPPQNAVVKGSAEPSFDISTYFVKDENVAADTVVHFKEQVFEASPYTLPTPSVEALLAQRYEDLTNFRATINNAEALNYDDEDQLS